MEDIFNGGDWGNCGLSVLPSQFPYKYKNVLKKVIKKRISLVAQLVKNLTVMQETWVQSLGWEDPLKEVMATHSSILALIIPMDRGDW